MIAAYKRVPGVAEPVSYGDRSALRSPRLSCTSAITTTVVTYHNKARFHRFVEPRFRRIFKICFFGRPPSPRPPDRSAGYTLRPDGRSDLLGGRGGGVHYNAYFNNGGGDLRAAARHRCRRPQRT